MQVQVLPNYTLFPLFCLDIQNLSLVKYHTLANNL